MPSRSQLTPLAERHRRTPPFSVNIPAEMVEIVDYCGLVSGNHVDKSDLFETFTGNWSSRQ